MFATWSTLTLSPTCQPAGRPQPHHLPYPSPSHPRPDLSLGAHAAVASHYLAEMSEYETEDCMPGPTPLSHPPEATAVSPHRASLTSFDTPRSVRRSPLRQCSQLCPSTSAAQDAPNQGSLAGAGSPRLPFQPAAEPQPRLTGAGHCSRAAPGGRVIACGVDTEAPQRRQMSSSPLLRYAS